MPTYILYHKKTGKIVHILTQPATMPVGKPGLVAMADSEHKRADLDTLEIDAAAMNADTLYQVDIKTKKLKAKKTKGISAIATAFYLSDDDLPSVDASKFKYVKSKTTG